LRAIYLESNRARRSREVGALWTVSRQVVQTVEKYYWAVRGTVHIHDRGKCLDFYRYVV